jgi:hypothetical protein
MPRHATEVTARVPHARDDGLGVALRRLVGRWPLRPAAWRLCSLSGEAGLASLAPRLESLAMVAPGVLGITQRLGEQGRRLDVHLGALVQQHFRRADPERAVRRDLTGERSRLLVQPRVGYDDLEEAEIEALAGGKSAFIVVLAVPFSAIGAIWFVYLLGYNMSIGVWVGLIALLGVDAETGVFMLLYLELAYEQAKREGRLRSLGDLQQAILQGAVKRLRPKFMTVATMFLGLIPIMWASGTGADVMKRIAAPMIGGILISFLLELVVYPPVYQIWKWNFEVKRRLSS